MNNHISNFRIREIDVMNNLAIWATVIFVSCFMLKINFRLSSVLSEMSLGI